jgi:hypothetical protein
LPIQTADHDPPYTLYGGFSVAILIQRCCEARLDLEEDDEEWIAGLWKAGKRNLATQAVAACGNARSASARSKRTMRHDSRFIDNRNG